jgi:hypothetical protein
VASKLFGRPVQGTRSAQNTGEFPLLFKSHSAIKTDLQMCTKTFQFLAAEFTVEIAQDFNSVIAAVHSENPGYR